MSTAVLDWDKKRGKGIIVSDYLDVIRSVFSVKNSSKELIKRRYGGAFIPDRVYAITNTGRFDVGLVFDIVREFKKLNIKCTITPLLQEKIQCGIDAVPQQLNIIPREYQQLSVKKAIQYGFGNFIIGTGGGKTLLMAMLAKTFNKITLIILPSHLVTQTSQDFKSYGIKESDIAIWEPKNNHVIKPIVFVSNRLLLLRLKNQKQKYEKILQQIEMLLFDEVHELRKDNKINKIFSVLKNVQNRFGFTGSLPENNIDKWNIIGKLGPILVDINSYNLRTKGYLTNVKCLILKIHYQNPPEFKSTLQEPNKAYQEEKQYISSNMFRHKICKQLCKSFDNNCLILVDRLEHGKQLYDQMSNIKEKECFWINAEVESEVREEIRQLMETKTNIICIAIAKIFSTGINIKNLHYIVFAQAGKAKITMVQAIGRGLRLHPNKERLLLIDIADMLRYGVEHFEARKRRYNEEQIPYETRDIYQQSNNS